MSMLAYYREQAVPKLMEELNLNSTMQVPRVTKITLNMGVGESLLDRKHLDRAVEELKAISGQSPVVTRARKSVASFKIRQGYPVGCMVTLRREVMYDFMERLVHIVLPRVRDFRGLNPRGFDAQGNYSLGVKEQIIFPEIDYDSIDNIRGMDICITNNAKNPEQGLALLNALQFPFQEKGA